MPAASANGRALRRLLGGLVLLSVGYLGVYGWARVTHRLVFNGHEVVGAGSTRGPPGLSTWEIVFLPPLLLESALR